MKKIIKDSMLCDNLSAEKQEQISKIASSVLNTETLSGNVVCFTTDIDTFYNSVILLNTAIYATRVNKKILIFDLDFKNKYIMAAVKGDDTKQSSQTVSKYNNIEYVSYDNKEIFIREMKEKEIMQTLQESFSKYDVVLVNLPSVIDDSAYLSLPKVFASFIVTIKRYKSRLPRINKIIKKIESDGKSVLGSIYDESIK